MNKLAHTSETAIAITFLVMNLSVILRQIFGSIFLFNYFFRIIDYDKLSVNSLSRKKLISHSWVAVARRGPTRTQTRPLKRTGGASDGFTITTANSQPAKVRFCTVMLGKGRILPSERISESVRNSSSVTLILAQVPSSLTPINNTPGFWWLGKSLCLCNNSMLNPNHRLISIIGFLLKILILI
ncbi:Transposase [Planktothrix rubescens NIVA-CYA 18]|nr:Transposase [Planktothrix rubescens NIVA-CYA 18]